jgi:hypothetical protein
MNIAEKLAREVIDAFTADDIARIGTLVTEDFMYRVENGLLAEHWGVRDELSVLWQVGALPVPAPMSLGAS